MIVEAGDLAFPKLFGITVAGQRRTSGGTPPGTGFAKANAVCFSFPSGGKGNLDHIGIWLLRYTDYIIS
jgi:hypothetical protein